VAGDISGPTPLGGGRGHVVCFHQNIAVFVSHDGTEGHTTIVYGILTQLDGSLKAGPVKRPFRHGRKKKDLLLNLNFPQNCGSFARFLVD
jgi:hypothetical protein